MKMKVKDTKEGFRPFVLELTFENSEDVDTFELLLNEASNTPFPAVKASITPFLDDLANLLSEV